MKSEEKRINNKKTSNGIKIIEFEHTFISNNNIAKFSNYSSTSVSIA